MLASQGVPGRSRIGHCWLSAVGFRRVICCLLFDGRFATLLPFLFLRLRLGRGLALTFTADKVHQLVYRARIALYTSERGGEGKGARRTAGLSSL